LQVFKFFLLREPLFNVYKTFTHVSTVIAQR